MNNKKNDFTVRFPIEYFTEWVKSEGVEDGYILDHQELKIENVEQTKEYLVVDGALTTRQDS